MILLHRQGVKLALYYASRWRFKQLSGLSEKSNLHVIQSGCSNAVDRLTRVCKTMASYFRSVPDLEGEVAVEIGSGDCLAAADMLLDMGLRHVHLVDQRPIIFSPYRRAITDALAADNTLPNMGAILAGPELVALNNEKATGSHRASRICRSSSITAADLLF